MGAAPILRPLNRRTPGVAAILQEWRRLTSPRGARRAGPGAPTLVACSGGTDSAALVLALAAAGGAGDRITVAHIVHDLREPALALADRDAVRALAAALRLEFVEASVSVLGGNGAGGNAEARARRERYRVLVELAHTRGASFIATAHHADDQLESVLMALVRGSGPRGLAGVAPSRSLVVKTDGDRPAVRARVIRPMLVVTRADAEAICRAAGYEPRIDHTNADTSRLRNALRSHVTPALRALRPAAAHKSVQAGALLTDAASLIRARARRVLRAATSGETGGITLARARLAGLPDAVLGEALRLACARCSSVGADRRSSRSIGAIMRAVRDDDGSNRRFTFGGVHAVLAADALTLSPASTSSSESPRADRPRSPRPDRSR